MVVFTFLLFLISFVHDGIVGKNFEKGFNVYNPYYIPNEKDDVFKIYYEVGKINSENFRRVMKLDYLKLNYIAPQFFFSKKRQQGFILINAFKLAPKVKNASMSSDNHSVTVVFENGQWESYIF